MPLTMFESISTNSANPVRFRCWIRGYAMNVGIPEKMNKIPEGRRTAFRSEGEQQSERSDAGEMIVQEVFGMVN